MSSTTVAGITAGCFGAAALIAIILTVLYCKTRSGGGGRRLPVHADMKDGFKERRVDGIPVGVTSNHARTTSQFI